VRARDIVATGAITCLIATVWTSGVGPAVATSTAPRTGTTSTGTVRIVAVDDPDHPDGASTDDAVRTTAMAEVDGALVQLPADQTDQLQAGDEVALTTVGTTSGPQVSSVRLTRSAPARLAAGLAGSVGAPITGRHTLTVLPVYWTSPDTATQASLSQLAASTADYWAAQSGGQIQITTAVRNWVRIANPGSCKSAAPLANAALAAHGVALPDSAFDHVVIYFPAWSDCGWAGLGQIGSSVIWDNGLLLPDVTSHEFGHNLGLGHANTATCTGGGARVTLSTSCSVAEYRDYADVMGAAMRASTGNLNTALADWLGLAKVTTVPAGGRATVDIAPLGRTDAVRAVRIQVPGGWVYLDDRPATAPDLRMTGWAGVQAHLLPDGAYPASQLLDGQPRTATAFAGVSLPAGTVWAVPGSGLTVTVTSSGPGGARLDVAPTGTDPGVPVPVLTAPTGGSLISSFSTVSWRLPSPAASVRVLVDGVQRGSLTTSALTGSLIVTGLSTGSHTITAQAADAGGRTGTPSAGVQLTADSSPPSTPTGLTLTPISVAAGETFGWRTSSDVGAAGLAGYLVALDGGSPTRLGAVTSATVKSPTGRHTWWVAAVDRLGNVSPASGLTVIKTITTSSRTTARSVVVRVVPAPAGTTLPRTITTGRTVGAAWLPF
jgi:hypothetical protein